MPTLMECEMPITNTSDCPCNLCRINRLILAARDEALEEAAKLADVWNFKAGESIRALRSPQPRPAIDPDAVQVRNDSVADLVPTGCMYCIGMQFSTGVGPHYCPKCGTDRAGK